MRKTLTLLMVFSALIPVSLAADLTVEILDDKDNTIDSTLILEQGGETIQQNDTYMEANLDPEEDYNLIQKTEGRIVNGEEVINLNVNITDFSINDDLDLRPRLLDNIRPEGEDFLSELDPFYFNNQSDSFEFTNARIQTNATQRLDEPDRIARCTEFNNLDCQQWDVTTIRDYETNRPIVSGEDDFWFEVEEFSAYSSGLDAPLPRIENIEIFENGQMIDEGLNKTFSINQSNPSNFEFRFTILNNGSDEWSLEEDDILQHEGLNESWNIDETEDIVYELDGEREGGSFEDGVVEWDTSEAGTLEEQETFNANYTVTIDQKNSETFNQEFTAETTEDTSDSDQHNLELLVFGHLEAFIQSPNPEEFTVLQNNREFTLNGTAECSNGDCGEITAEPLSDGTSFGDEFDIIEQENKCGELINDETCEIEWNVNASGEPDTSYNLSFETSSEFEEVPTSETNESEVEIQDILMIDLDYEVIDFGRLDAGEENRPASENDQGGYNLTVDEESNSIDNLWIKGTDLLHEDEPDDYSIPINNVSYTEENDPSDDTNVTNSFSRVTQNLSPGSVKTLYYWLDVPLGILSGGYDGSITFKANQTE